MQGPLIFFLIFYPSSFLLAMCVWTVKFYLKISRGERAGIEFSFNLLCVKATDGSVAYVLNIDYPAMFYYLKHNYKLLKCLRLRDTKAKLFVKARKVY